MTTTQSTLLVGAVVGTVGLLTTYIMGGFGMSVSSRRISKANYVARVLSAGSGSPVNHDNGTLAMGVGRVSSVESTVDAILKNTSKTEFVAVHRDKDTLSHLLTLSINSDLYTVHLLPFCRLFHETYSSRVIRTTTFLFIIDLTGKSTSSLLDSLLPTVFGIPIISTVNWSAYISCLVNEITVSPSDATTLVKSLFLLSSLPIPTSNTNTNKTIAFASPNINDISSLLPHIHSAFSHDRIVFAYDSCSDVASLMTTTTGVGVGADDAMNDAAARGAARRCGRPSPACTVSSRARQRFPSTTSTRVIIRSAR